MSAHNDAAFLRMFLFVLGALVAFTVIIIFAANRITGAVDEARGQDPRERVLVAERIKPVGEVNVAGRPAPAPSGPAPKAAEPLKVAPAAEAPAGTSAESASQAAASVVETVAAGAESTAAAVAGAVSEVTAGAAAAPDLDKGKSVYSSACFACHLTGAAGAPKLDDKAAWAPRIAQGMDALVANSINGKGAMPPKGGRMDIPDADIAAAVAYMVSQAE